MSAKNDSAEQLLTISASSLDVRAVRKWSKFLSALGVSVSFCLIIVAVFGGSILRNLEELSNDGGRNSYKFTISLLVAASVLSVLSFILARFSKSLKPEKEKDAAFRYLKIFFRFAVISVLIFILHFLFIIFYFN